MPPGENLLLQPN